MNAREILLRYPHQLDGRAMCRRPDGAEHLILLRVPTGRGDVGMAPAAEADIA